MRYDTEHEARQGYIEMLNECGRTKPRNLPVATVMFTHDPIMFRCGFNDWLDGLIQDSEVPAEAEDWSFDPEDADVSKHDYHWN